jgi:hypothetical protein
MWANKARACSLHKRSRKGMEPFSCVLLRGDLDVRGARGSADFSLFSASEGSCGGSPPKMQALAPYEGWDMSLARFDQG